MIKFIFFVLFFPLSSQASSILDDSRDFLNWLDKNKSQFSACSVEKDKTKALLCDQTEVDIEFLEKLFKLNDLDLINEIEKSKVRIQYVCDKNETTESSSTRCAKKSLTDRFKKMTLLHGLYVPEESTILLKESSAKAVIIHEYIHHLQSINTKKIDGRLYKPERNKIQQQINIELDRLMAEISELEKKKDQKAVMAKATLFIQINDVLLKLGKWQDFIDERGIFSLFLKFQSKFGLSAEDLALVKKNMKFICNSAALKDFPMPECSLY